MSMPSPFCRPNTTSNVAAAAAGGIFNFHASGVAFQCWTAATTVGLQHGAFSWITSHCSVEFSAMCNSPSVGIGPMCRRLYRFGRVGSAACRTLAANCFSNFVQHSQIGLATTAFPVELWVCSITSFEAFFDLVTPWIRILWIFQPICSRYLFTNFLLYNSALRLGGTFSAAAGLSSVLSVRFVVLCSLRSGDSKRWQLAALTLSTLTVSFAEFLIQCWSE